jgi:hypothetical protein
MLYIPRVCNVQVITALYAQFIHTIEFVAGRPHTPVQKVVDAKHDGGSAQRKALKIRQTTQIMNKAA